MNLYFMMSLYSCLFHSLGTYLAIQWMTCCQLRVPWLPGTHVCVYAVSRCLFLHFISCCFSVSMDPASVSHLLHDSMSYCIALQITSISILSYQHQRYYIDVHNCYWFTNLGQEWKFQNIFKFHAIEAFGVSCLNN